jgi:TDG/mug DNA glycosylase family protein
VKTEQVNLRLEADLISALERAAEEECVDRGTMIRKLLLGALKQRAVDRALQQYQMGEISIGRAAEDARLTHWEILDLARRRGIAYQIDLEEIAERLELDEQSASHRVAEGVAAYSVHRTPPSRARRHSKVARQRAQVAGAATLPDLPPRRGGVLLVGLSPAPRSVAAGHYYQGRLGRRLWQRLAHAGLLTDAVPGSEDDAWVTAGHGLTDLVKRPTASASDLERDELQEGALELREKVRAWQPGLILFVFKEAARVALGSPVSPGTGPSLEGVPTFLLSGPYAARNDSDRVNAKLRQAVSMDNANGSQAVVSQRVTEADLEAGIIRLPRSAKALLPNATSEKVPITLRGTPLTASYDPKRGPDRERSGVLRIGRAALSRLVKSGERLRVSKGPNGRVQLD